MVDQLRTLLAKLITALNIGPASFRARAWLWLASATDNLEEKRRPQGELQMISEEDITEAREKEKILTESYYLLKKLKTVEPSKVTKQEETEQINRLRKAIDATKPFAQPTGFSTLVGWHIALLVAGLLLYALAQVLGTPM